MDCIFCKIIKKETASDIEYEDEKVMVFKDINPKAAVHLLIVPKVHIESIESRGAEHVAGDLVAVAKKIAERQRITGYKLLFNVGRQGGQLVEHLHLHFLAGQSIKLP